MPYKITITEFHKSLLNTLFKWSNTIEIRFNIKTRGKDYYQYNGFLITSKILH